MNDQPDQPRVSAPGASRLRRGNLSRFGTFLLIAGAASLHCSGAPRHIDPARRGISKSSESSQAVTLPTRTVVPAAAPVELSSPQDPRPKTVVLIVIDGARWQEIFSGTDRALAKIHALPDERATRRTTAGSRVARHHRKRRSRSRSSRARSADRGERAGFRLGTGIHRDLFGAPRGGLPEQSLSLERGTQSSRSDRRGLARSPRRRRRVCFVAGHAAHGQSGLSGCTGFRGAQGPAESRSTARRSRSGPAVRSWSARGQLPGSRRLSARSPYRRTRALPPAPAPAAFHAAQPRRRR